VTTATPIPTNTTTPSTSSSSPSSSSSSTPAASSDSNNTYENVTWRRMEAATDTVRPSGRRQPSCSTNPNQQQVHIMSAVASSSQYASLQPDEILALVHHTDAAAVDPPILDGSGPADSEAVSLSTGSSSAASSPRPLITTQLSDTGSGGTTDDADRSDRGDAAPPTCKKTHTPTNPTASASAGPMDGGGVECEPVSPIECNNKLILSAPRHTM